MKKFDYLIVGAGLFGSVVAHELTNMNKRVLVVDKKPHVGGTVYTETICDIQVHTHGAHIFRTDDKFIWEYMTQFCDFYPFINTPIAISGGIAYNLPFNMNLFAKLWNITKPEEAKSIIRKQILDATIPDKITNLEDYAISQVGTELYEKFIKEYTEKQWKKSCKDLPSSILNRIPVRYTYNNNYYNAKFQGIPTLGYTYIVEQLLKRADVWLGTDGKQLAKDRIADKVIYTGSIDEYFDYRLGKLEYRSVRFDHKIYAKDNLQGVAVVNWSDSSVPYTRSIEHKHFLGINNGNTTVISYEYPTACDENNEPIYPITSENNLCLYRKYLALTDDNIIFGGRLGSYKYYDMQDTIKNALQLVKSLKERRN